jgi:uncharacterized protein YlzI (FlbEa/FlbD family)
MSKHIRSVFAVPEAAVVLTAGEKGVATERSEAVTERFFVGSCVALCMGKKPLSLELKLNPAPPWCGSLQ